jgi:hypothetical protein
VKILLAAIAVLVLSITLCAQSNPVLIIGNSDAAMNGATWPTNFPGVPYQVRSFYSMTCEDILRFLGPVLQSWQNEYGTPPVIVNFHGQCDAESNPPTAPAALMSCVQSTSAMENSYFPGVPQIWVNVAPEPQYATGPPSNYPGTIWETIEVYNSYYTMQGLTIVDAWTPLALGVWGNPAYFTYPSVDPNPAGENAIDVVLGPVLYSDLRNPRH